MPPANRVEVPCSHCGQATRRTPWEIGHAKRLYCSRACKDAAFRLTCSGSGNPKYGYRKGRHLTCIVCGAAFYLQDSYLAQPGRTGEFCSAACYNTRKSERLKGIPKSAEARANLSAAKKGVPNLKRRKPPVSLACLHCTQAFRLSGRHTYLAKAQRFCSRACWYAYVRLHPEESGKYRGGIYKPLGPEWEARARQARERDDHTCCDCGKRQVRPLLDVHHVIPRRDFGGDFGAADRLENLVTLCKPCHTARESRLTPAYSA